MDSKRRYGRMPFTNRLTVTDLSNGHSCKANAINLSLGGIKLYSERFFETGTRLRIHIWPKHSAEDNPIETVATVRWAGLENDGAILGTEFDKIVSRAENLELWELLDRG